MVKFLENTAIDREKWDRCIAAAFFETIYPYSWYLDLVSPGWGGLVKGDYEMVMPLPATRKFGFHMLLQPLLIQQLGIFSETPASPDQIQEFLDAVPSRFRYIDLCLNTSNNRLPKGVRKADRVNYQMDLRDTVTEYSTNTQRNLQKGRMHEFEFSDIPLSRYLDLKYAPGQKLAVDREYMEHLFGGLQSLGKARTCGLSLQGVLHAAAVIGYSKSRVIYMNGVSSREGKDTRAMFVLMDRLIQESRDAYQIFDFEGSNIPGVARFFDGFGAVETFYPRIIIAKFPFFRFG